MTTLQDVDIRLMLGRLCPQSAYRWVGQRGDRGYTALDECVTDWNDSPKPIPTEADLIIEWETYQFEEVTRQQQEAADLNKAVSARTAAKAISNWATWDEAQVLAWFDNNLGDAAVDALTIPVGAKTIIKAQNTALKAMARMIVALRDDTWPDLSR